MNKLYVAMSLLSAVSMVINTWLMILVTKNTQDLVKLMEELIKVAAG